MTSRERFLLALNHKESDRIPIHDSPWGTTVARWHREGLPEGVSPGQYFGYELNGFGGDISLQLPSELIEETDEYTIVKNADGAIVKNWKHQTSTPEKRDFTITDRKAWEEHKDRMKYNDGRVNWGAIESCKRMHEEGNFVTFSAAIGYDRTQGLVGSVNLLMAILDDPEWVKDLFKTNAELVITVAEEMMAKGFEFDAAFLYDDNGYKNATLFSPTAYKELLFPYHKMLFDFFNSKGLPTILHTCGCVNPFVPHYIEAGLTCLQPLEVKAGMDLIELKKNYGEHLAFMGGIDVRCMASDDPREIEEEIKTKIPVAKKGGGYIYHSDHSVPDNVSFPNYKRTMELVMEYGKY